MDNIETIKAYLISKYDKISDEWNVIIDMLSDNLEQYNDIKNEIKRTGYFFAETGKRNPLLTSLKDLQLTITKQLQILGIGPLYASKIKNLDNSTTDVLSSLLTIDE